MKLELKKPQTSLKTTFYVAMAIATLVITTFQAGVWYALSQAISNPGTTYGPGDVDAYSYVIFKEGSTYYAKNGTTRAIDYNGTDATTVINNVFSTISKGYVVLKGDIDIGNNWINMVSKSNVALIGAYPKATITGNGQYMIYGGSWKNVTIKNIDFIHTYTGTGGRVIVTGATDNVLFEDILLQGIGSAAGYEVLLEISYNGVSYNKNVRLNRVKLINGGNVDVRGVVIYAAYNVVMENSYSENINDEFGISKDATTPRSKMVWYRNNIKYDDTTGVNAVNSEGPEFNSVDGLHIYGNIQKTSGDVELSVGGFGIWGCTDVEIYGNIIDSTNNGIGVLTPSGSSNARVNIFSNEIYNVGRSPSRTTGTPIGIAIYTPTSGTTSSLIQIHNNIVKDPLLQAVYVGYPDNNVTGISSISMHSNVFSGGAVVWNNPSSSVRRANEGYVTENSGTTTISASTSVTVNHGLAGTPTTVTVTPRQTGYGTIAITARNATTFTITVTVSGTYNIDWYAEYKP